MAGEFAIQGLGPVTARLKALQGKDQVKAIRAALRRGAGIVRKDAAGRAAKFDDPSTTSNISKDIVVRQGKARGSEVRMRVGVRGGAKAYVNNARNRREGRVGKAYEGGGNVYHWRFLEFGTAKMAAQPFMRPALDSNAERVIDSFSGDLEKAIDKIVAKGAR